jgi:hypothetical protein
MRAGPRWTSALTGVVGGQLTVAAEVPVEHLTDCLDTNQNSLLSRPQFLELCGVLLELCGVLIKLCGLLPELRRVFLLRDVQRLQQVPFYVQPAEVLVHRRSQSHEFLELILTLLELRKLISHAWTFPLTVARFRAYGTPPGCGLPGVLNAADRNHGLFH